MGYHLLMQYIWCNSSKEIFMGEAGLFALNENQQLVLKNIVITSKLIIHHETNDKVQYQVLFYTC